MNTAANVNVSSKSQLAKLLAIENIHVQHSAAAQTASFDVKSRVLILPVWKEMSNDLYDMLVIHEVGHALDTPAEGWLDTIKDISKRVNGLDSNRGVMSVKGFLNVVEDARIDKRQKRRFPGSKRNYVIGYKDLFERDFFGIANRDVNGLSFIDRMNIYFKGGFAMNIKFSPEEKSFIKRAEDAETWADVVALTEDIYRFSKEKNDLDQQTKLDRYMTDDGNTEAYDDEDGEVYYNEADDEAKDETDGKSGRSKGEADDEAKDETDGKSGRSKGEGDDEEDDDAEADGEGEADDDEGDKAEESNKDNEAKKTSAGEAGDFEQDLPQAETDRAFEERKQELVAANAENYHYVKLPKPNMSKIVDDYKVVMASWRNAWVRAGSPAIMTQFNEWKTKENASISFMVKEFESKKAADIYSRISIAKTGVIDTNKLHTYKYNDDIFRRLSVVPNGKNHGFVMFIDWSYSMKDHMRDTIKQLCSMVMFCKRVQIPFDVYLFRNINDNESKGFRRSTINESYFPDSNSYGYFNINAFKLRNILSSRMNGADLNFAMAYLQFYLGYNYKNDGDLMDSTPLNQAIICADQIINEFRAKHKVQVMNTIFLTDGDSDPLPGVNGIYAVRGRFILQDDYTHNEYDLGDLSYGRKLTNILLRRLKDRTGGNLVGFFLTSGGFYRNFDINVGQTTYEYRTKMEKFWKDNGFMPSTSQGYDQYFLVNTHKLNVVADNLEVNGDMSHTKITSAFMKFSEKKTVNRVLLRQFIDLIAA